MANQMKYYGFISHYKEEAGQTARIMKLMMKDKLQGHQELFLDSDQLSDLSELLKAVRESGALVVILTKNYFTRPWCLAELVEAFRNDVPLVSCRIVGIKVEFDPSNFQPLVDDCRRVLTSDGLWRVLKDLDIYEADVSAAIKRLSEVIARPFGPNGHEKIQNVEMEILFEDLQKRSTFNSQPLPSKKVMPPLPLRHEPVPKQKVRVAEVTRKQGSTKGGLGESAEELYKRRLQGALVEYFERVDPERATRSVDILVKYVLARGLPAMKEKLWEKYQIPFELPPIHKLEPMQKALVTGAQGSDEVGTQNRDFKEILLEFYSKYDPTYVSNGRVNIIIAWTEKNGRDVLNERLKMNYGESLDEFERHRSELSDALVHYYTRVDPDRLSRGIDLILRWGVKNGEKALDRKLKAKYGVAFIS